MNRFVFLSGVAVFMLGVTACNDDDRLESVGQGRLLIRPEIKTEVNTVGSRAADDEQQLKESLILWISNSKGPVRKYSGESQIPAEEWLVSDSYLAEAWAGDSVSASFDKRWFKGSQLFEIRAGETSQVTLPCKIANSLVEVKYAETISEIFSDYSMSVGHKKGSLTFVGSESRTGYFMMPSYDKNLVWTFSATTATGEKVTRSGEIKNARPATKYILNVVYNRPLTGGASMDIEVDMSEEKIYDEVMIELPPVIQGIGFNPGEEFVVKAGEIGRRSLLVSASSSIKSATMHLEGLSTLLGVKDSEDNDFNRVDFISADDVLLESIRQAGINTVYTFDSAENTSLLRINLEEEFTSRLTDGAYALAFAVTDGQDRLTNLTFNIRVSGEPLRLDELMPADVWATSATLSATALRDGLSDVSFRYRRVGSEEWIAVQPLVSGSKLTAQLTALEPGAEYEYYATADNGDFATKPLTFTTEAALQLPNAGFEKWSTGEKNVVLIGGDGEELFWDSGNHGSITLNKNVTTAASDIKHSGEYSIRLQSQFVGISIFGKFAAGNVFIGKYLATLVTDGLLGWGRPFASRPKALKGYVKYTPQAVTHSSTSAKPKGEMDEGMIYIAILDDQQQNPSEDYPGWPVIVNTKTKQLFNKDDPGVIAYGEKIWTEATAGDGMVEFEIPLEYVRKDAKAVNIVLTCTASRYGDYFTGGPSVMYLDDLQLVY